MPVGAGASAENLMRPDLDLGPPERAILNVVQPPNDVNMDCEAGLLISKFDRVMLRMQKAAHWGHRGVGGDDALKGEENIGKAAAVLHDALQFSQPSFEADAVPTICGLGCTNLSFHLGPARVDTQLKKIGAKGKPLTTDMARAQVAALRALGAQRVALLTPYTDGPAQINSQVVLGSSAFRVCVPGFIDRLEQRLSVPVVTSTQAFFWYMLNQVGVEDPIDGYGSLFAGRVASPPPAARSSAPISFEEGLASLDDGPRSSDEVENPRMGLPRRASQEFRESQSCEHGDLRIDQEQVVNPPIHDKGNLNAYGVGMRLVPGKPNPHSLYKPVFEPEEFDNRVEKLRISMRTSGITVCIVCSPSNINYLTGFDGWGFYQPHFVVVTHRRVVLVARGMDAAAGHSTTHLAPEDILEYPDTCVDHPVYHPIQLMRGLVEQGQGQPSNAPLDLKSIAFEQDGTHCRARYLPELHKMLAPQHPYFSLPDAQPLLSWIRAVKSPAELDYIRKAAKIADATVTAAAEMIKPGVRQCDVAAEVMKIQARDGVLTAIPPMIMVDDKAGHMTWTEDEFQEGQLVQLEFAGAVQHYHCPISRSVRVTAEGAVGDDVSNSEADKCGAFEAPILRALHAALDATRVGRTTGDVSAAFNKVLETPGGTVKKSRVGYSFGLGYSPDWGEGSFSVRPGDTTELVEGMCIHLIAGAGDAFAFRTSAPLIVTANGPELLCELPLHMLTHSGPRAPSAKNEYLPTRLYHPVLRAGALPLIDAPSGEWTARSSKAMRTTTNTAAVLPTTSMPANMPKPVPDFGNFSNVMPPMSPPASIAGGSPASIAVLEDLLLRDAKNDLEATDRVSEKATPMVSLPTIAATMGVGACYVKDESLRMDDSSSSSATPFREVFEQIRNSGAARVTHIFVQGKTDAVKKDLAAAGAAWLEQEADMLERDVTFVCVGGEGEEEDKAEAEAGSGSSSSSGSESEAESLLGRVDHYMTVGDGWTKHAQGVLADLDLAVSEPESAGVAAGLACSMCRCDEIGLSSESVVLFFTA
mmetsp:Transcript_57648/g.158780  ORF Transcript_57648/g.158780 Transcript_57648/m.158780 type:complete len:1038 (-) Transcript_57648:486-3599(-)